VLCGIILCLHQYGTHTCWNCNNLTAVCSLSGEQVKQSQEHLLERLYAYVTGLKPQELDMLLDEDSELTQKRAAAQMTIKVGLVQPGIAASGLATGFCWPCCCSCSCGMWFWLPVQAAKFGQNEFWPRVHMEGHLQRGCAARSPQSRPVAHSMSHTSLRCPQDITSSIVEIKRVEEHRLRTNEDERPPKEEVSRAVRILHKTLPPPPSPAGLPVHPVARSDV